jgi:hypothetical protein
MMFMNFHLQDSMFSKSLIVLALLDWFQQIRKR